MLSTSVLKNVNQASHYYSHKDNYYTRDEGMNQSEWWGKGAKHLELSGQVDAKKFIELLQGKLPNGEQLSKVVDGELKHRPGWDLTFSAPKSVSSMAYIGGDKRLIEAHYQAVYVALSCIERFAAQARISTPNGMQYQNTGNLVGALQHHDISREYDPQMHTHAIIMNMTERSDGLWRSLASNIGRYNEGKQGEVNGFIERVRHYNRYLSKIYETELAYQVKQLGYDITTDTKSGIFEIKGVPQEAIQFFSKRRNQIEEQLEDKGLSGGKAAAVATLVTREAKVEVDREKLKEKWQQDAKNLGFDYQALIDTSYQKNKASNPEQRKVINIDQKIINAINKAAHSLSIFQTTFSFEEIIAEASSFAIQDSISVESLISGIEIQLSKGELLSISNLQGKTNLMAKTTLEDEKRLIAQLKDNKLLNPKVSSNQLSNYLTQHEKINSNYHEHLKTVFSNVRMVMIEGKAAKEMLIEPVCKIAKLSNLNIAVLSPSLVGSKQFAKEVKQNPKNFWDRIKTVFVDTTPKHYSVMQFLSQFNETDKSPKNIPDLLIVDNAHLLSTHQKANLFELSNKHQSKLILLGNKDTLLPQQRGTSIGELIEHGMPTISLSNKESQTDKTIIKENIDNLLNKMSDKIIEVRLIENRHHAMAKHYSNLAEADRKSSWLAGQNKKSVEELNIKAHQSLTSDNKIKKNKELNILIPVFLPDGKGVLASSYKKDQVVRFNEDYKSLTINRGEYLKIISHHEKSNRVVLKKENGKEIIWQPDKVAGKSGGKVELFDEKKREIGIGETIIFNRSIKSKEIIKGERFTVDAMKHGKIRLKSNHKSVMIDFNKPYHRHFDYGYAATPHAIAHEKPNYLIAEMPAKSIQTDQRYFNQVISQPKEAWIYTDNYMHLISNLEKKSGDRLSAHETLKKSEELKVSFHALYDALEKEILNKSNHLNVDVVKKSIDAIDYAMRHLAEREAGFTHKDLIHVAMKYAIGDVTQSMLTRVTVAMEKAGLLFRGNRNNGTLWTTVEAVKIEREILMHVTRDKGKLQPIASDELLSIYYNPAFLRPEQIDAIKAITQSKDRVLSVQGRAGTGKTKMMVTLNDVLSAKELLAEGGYQLQGIAPTHKGVKELLSRGIAAQTVDSFLLDMRRIQENKLQQDYTKTLLVVDEASMVSNRKMLEILKVVHDFKFREVIPTGDIEQNPAIEAGKPHDLIQLKLNDTTILLKDIQRQKNRILKKAVQAIYDKDINQTFSILKDSIKEISKNTANDPLDIGLKPDALHYKYYSKRIEAIARDYISLLEKGEDVQIIAPSHVDRKAVNKEVRFQLDKLNRFKGEEHSFSVLSSKDMTGVERSEEKNFNPGQILRFTVSSGKTIKAGDYFRIKSIDKNLKIFTLNNMNGDNKEVVWQVPRSQNRINNAVEVFNKEDRNIKIGDKIVWVRTNRKEGILSTDFAYITHIESGLITVKRPDNSVFTFDSKDEKYQHWDHGYAITAHGAQGGSYSAILAIYESQRKKLCNLKNFLVTITRPINHLRIYTDDIEKLKENVANNTGNKTSSLEVIDEYPGMLKQPKATKHLGGKQIYNDGLKQHSQVSKQVSDNKISNKSMNGILETNNSLSHYKNILNQEKILFDELVQNLNLHDKSHQKIDKMVGNNLLKTNNKIKDIEREI